ncbi:MAG: hypothetical protein LBQ05_02535 [Christensenellaceae bacterium]|jgi:hypothetical protein|nr:hypothetical protein [Christensenellaceae bacterium]
MENTKNKGNTKKKVCRVVGAGLLGIGLTLGNVGCSNVVGMDTFIEKEMLDGGIDIEFPIVAPATRQKDVNTVIDTVIGQTLEQNVDIAARFKDNSNIVGLEDKLYVLQHEGNFNAVENEFDAFFTGLVNSADLKDIEKRAFQNRRAATKVLTRLDEVKYFKYSTDKAKYDEEVEHILSLVESNENNNFYITEAIKKGNLDVVASILTKENMDMLYRGQTTTNYNANDYTKESLYRLAQQSLDNTECLAWLGNLAAMGYDVSAYTAQSKNNKDLGK